MSSHTEVTTGPCLTCGAPLSGRYCSECGERAAGNHDLQIGHLFHDFWHEFTHLDGRIWGSFLRLLARPGELTKAYWEGRRGQWMRPLRIFLIVTALSLLLVPDAAGPLGLRIFATQGANGTEISVGQRRPTRQQAGSGVHIGPGDGNVAQGKARLGYALSEEALAALNAKIFRAYKIVQYLSLTLFALASWLLLRRGQPYFGGYLILALHFYSFEYVLTGLATRLQLNPLAGLVIGLAYLTVALWKTTGRGREIVRAYGLDFGSLWRAVVLMGAVAASELLAMGFAGWLALRGL